MARGKKKAAGAKGRKLTLKAARDAVRTTPDGARRLDLSNAGLAAFPACLLKLADALDELDLSRNRLASLPDAVGDMRRLRSLDLHSNRLEKLPESIGRLASLDRLDVANNRLTAAGVPASLGSLSRLRSLNLGLNRLDALPASMVALTALRELGLFDNLLDRLPEFVKVLPGLVRLNAERNPLTAEGGGAKTVAPAEGVYLAKDGSLCPSCQENAREARRRGRGGGGGGGGDGGGGRPFSGLATPNSVAKANQEAWR